MELKAAIPNKKRSRSVMKIELDNSVAAPREARRRLQVLTDWANTEVVETAQLLVSELVTNSLRHANIPSGGRILLEAKTTPSGVHVEVSNPLSRFKKPDRYESGPDLVGWGLYLIEALSNDWGIEHRRGLTTVWFSLSNH